ncbi:MAG: hypothetical protein A2X94_09695 [Bdellovibrionales bacterium GWB1_55_8]|nr:MAG: hypothetical protein A2X94_09695 [Bdellovibrionales bacterium GWB1_55_8]
MHESGVKFLPEPVFSCLSEIIGFFERVAADFAKVRDESYVPAHSTVSFGKLTTGMGKIELSFDLRLLPELSPDELQKHIQDGIQKIARGYPGLNIGAARERMNPGLSVPENHEFVTLCQQAMKEAGLDPTLAKKATSTEAAQYQQAGYPAVVFGPGVSVGNSHSPNEHNLVDHLERAIAFYERVIEKACL